MNTIQAVEEKYEPKKFWKKEMRALKVKGAYLPAPLEKRKSLQAMATKLKKDEGFEFEIRKVGGILTIWRTK